MLRQKLRILILQHLSEKPRAGYGLIKDIEQATGWKPSYGSIYPTLDHLHEEGLVTFKEEGRKKIYSLTAAGKNAKKEFQYQHAAMLDKMRENMKLMAHMIGFNDGQHDEILELFFSAIKRGEQPFAGVMKSSTKMKMVFWELYRKGLIKKHQKEINAIVDDATKKLERLLKKG